MEKNFFMVSAFEPLEVAEFGRTNAAQPATAADVHLRERDPGR
jgi:hypothetical protein